MATALFTGAGASRAIGYSLTSELLPRIRKEIKTQELFADTNGKKQDAHDRGQLLDYLTRLLPGFPVASDKNLPLITDVFSLVEHSIASGESLPVGNDKALRRFRDLLKQAMADILVGEFLVGYDDGDEQQVKEQQTLKKLKQWFKRQDDDFGIVTTNYDTGLEVDLYRDLDKPLHESLDLGFEWREVDNGKVRLRPKKPKLRVYKLHGSFDVLRCPLCSYVYFDSEGVIVLNPFMDGDDVDNTCHCHEDARLESHIVSPSFVRDVREVNLLSVWHAALEWLRIADHWIMVGYSLPPEDLAIRSLLIRAYAGAKKKPRITVVQQSDAAESRYKLLFPDCRYKAIGLEGFLDRELRK